MLLSVDSIIDQTIDSLADSLRTLSLSIHANPEVALKEHHASKSIISYLRQQGHDVHELSGDLSTAFIATYKSPRSSDPAAAAAAAAGSSGLTIGFCSEYDALPKIGHACGHNLIAISGIAMFLALSATVSNCRLPNTTIKLFGTPAEEAIGGKLMMQDAGVFDGCDLLLMLHPGPGYTGSWHSQCSQSMTVEYFGKSAHAAMAPWDGISAAHAATIALASIGVLREQMKPAWRAHGIVAAGGDAANVVPDYARVEYTVRTPCAGELEVLRERVRAVFDAAAMATGCSVRVAEERAYLDNRDNLVLGRAFEEAMRREYARPPMAGVGGSTDFGNLSHRVPSLHAMYDLAGTGVPNHSLAFARDAASPEAHARTLFAAKTVARLAARCVVDGAFWDEVVASSRLRGPAQ